jgi:phytol kinase
MDLFPEPSVIAIVTPLTIVSIFGFLYLSGTIKLSHGIKTNYTRKLFHILVFTLAGVVGFFWGFKAVMFYGGITALIVIYVIYLGRGNLLFEGIGREQDEPHRAFYIGVPFISTAIAGLLNNFLFAELALVGYLVAGWGDAIGEPVGVRFGKHRYKVPSLRRVGCERSIEGSLAIMSMSMVGTGVALYVIGITAWWVLIPAALVTGLATAVIEAYSPHGIDNFTTQVVAVSVCFGVVNLL